MTVKPDLFPFTSARREEKYEYDRKQITSCVVLHDLRIDVAMLRTHVKYFHALEMNHFPPEAKNSLTIFFSSVGETTPMAVRWRHKTDDVITVQSRV